MTILSKLLSPASRRPAPTRRPANFDWSDTFNKVMDSMQKYQDIPRRFQKKWLTNFAGSLLLLVVVAGIYLNLTARAAIAGREIQNLEAEMIANQQLNADLQTLIAETHSKISLEDRAIGAGFEPITRENITYLTVPGYFPPQRTEFFSPVENNGSAGMPEEYSETLFTWIARQLESASTPLARTQ